MVNKLFKIVLALFLLVSPVMAQESEDLFFEINDFSKGLQSHVSPYLVSGGAATESFNVRINNEFGALAKREKMLELSTCQAAAVKSIHRYYKSDDTDYLIQTSSTKMDSVDDTSGGCTEIDTSLTDGKRWTWVTYKDIAVGCNGSNRCQKWDGVTDDTANTDAHRTASELTADLGAPFAELNTGTDLDASSWYQYRVSFYNGTTHSFSSARSNPINTGSSVHNITLTDIPIGPTGTTTRYIFRTLGNASKAAVLADTVFYNVATISNNTARTVNDAMADVDADDDAAPILSTVEAGTDATPPYAELALIHKEQLFLANDPSGTESGKSTVYWSDLFNPDYFDTANDYELIRPDDGDEITFILNLRNLLTIGKTNSVQFIYTEDSNDTNWVVSQDFSHGIGCVAPYSAKSTPQGIFYLGRFGLYLFNGNIPEIVSDTVTGEIRDIIDTSLQEVVSVYHDNQYIMAYTSEATGSSVNDRVLILDTIRNSYVKDIKEIDSFVIFDSGSDFGTLYSGSSDTDGTIFAHSGGFNQLVFRYKSELDSGTKDDTYSGGTENSPILSIGWTETWATVSGTWASQGDATWLMPDTDGTWISPAVQINSSALDKLYWNEDLKQAGDVTWSIRLAATEAGITGASWSSEFTAPSGSDISGLTENVWVQLRASLSAGDTTETPEVYVNDSFLVKMTYNRSGTGGESTINSIWESGYLDLNGTKNPKRIKEIQVFYTGDTGTLTLAYENDQGNVSSSFDVDMSVIPSDSSTDNYFGNGSDKIYSYILPVTDNNVGRNWQFTVAETGVNAWRVRKVVVRYNQNEYVPMRG